MAKTLTAANQKTEWWDLRGLASSICVNLTGSFNQAVTVHYSNLDDYDKETAYRADPVTYSTADGPLEFPFGIAKWIRFASGGSWGSGTTCVPLFARAKDPNGQLVDVNVQDIADAA